MGEALFELENVLRKEKITSQEANILMQCKSNALRAFTLGATGAAAVSWFASMKLHNVHRVFLTAGGSFVVGMRTFRRSLDSSLNYILSLDGTRMQKELGVLMLQKYQDDPTIMQRISKHFYSEEVYDDSSDRPRLRWRFRNSFGENAAYPLVTDEHASNSEKSDQKRTISENSDPEPNQAQMNAAGDAVENPFDCIFGIPAEVNEIQPTNRSNAGRSKAVSKRHAHGNKRFHRRHRKHQQEASEA
ncbi:uncharacterized protein LOC113765171 [Coffea eugenioides]|uniref:uncharacterized protein LOC113765171 n=1 Tax=Coffea eugenioides TaxID=49369 RepID=UPI000F610BC1|nr:uncharacterized protein LOC113765171 [Coffea eugenioides]